jgi:lipoprotein-anchoring transpeptidase ErfK/SrfK
MINQDVIDLYQRTPVGTKVAVLAVASASARSG